MYINLRTGIDATTLLYLYYATLCYLHTGIETYVVAIGSGVNLTEVTSMASDPAAERIMNPDSYFDLLAEKEEIVCGICKNSGKFAIQGVVNKFLLYILQNIQNRYNKRKVL